MLRDTIGNLALPASDQAYFDAYDCTVGLGGSIEPEIILCDL